MKLSFFSLLAFVLLSSNQFVYSYIQTTNLLYKNKINNKPMFSRFSKGLRAKQDVEWTDTMEQLPLTTTDDLVQVPDVIENVDKNAFIQSYLEELKYIKDNKDAFPLEDYHDMMQELKHNEISQIFIHTNYKQVVSLHIDNVDSISYHMTNIHPALVSNLIEKTIENNVPIYFENFTPDVWIQIQNIMNEIIQIGSYGLPILFILTLFSPILNFFSNPISNTNVKKGGNSLQGPNSNPFQMSNPMQSLFKQTEIPYIKPNVSISSWMGSPEIVEECKEIISYIETKEKFDKIGAEIPRGILLDGPPGTGKTLLAKAIATETNSTFISIAGSEFVEMFVGMGAAKVRELFNTARLNSPCIIFIDEIDAVGKQRGGPNGGMGGSNDEREQTLNQLLYEMDGFENNEGITIIAASNRRDVLDKALLRPGRFDRIIRVPLPDKDSREKILGYYLEKMNNKSQEQIEGLEEKEKEKIDVSAIAEMSDGFSGAQLKNLVNEAGIFAVRNNDTQITQTYLFDAFEKSIVGLIRKNATTSSETTHRVAIHEIGHVFLTIYYYHYFEFQKVSIQSTYEGAGGYTILTINPNNKIEGLYTKDLLKKRLMIMMGGKVAETIFYGEDHVSSGATQDLKQANELARQMIGNYGMGNELQVFYDENVEKGTGIMNQNIYSEETKQKIDKEVYELVSSAYKDAFNIINKEKNDFMILVELLKEKKVLYKKDLPFHFFGEF